MAEECNVNGAGHDAKDAEQNNGHSKIHGLYQAFAILNDQIRVVDVLPGLDSDALTLECRIVGLDDGSEYGALSYVWGHSKAKAVLTISGHSVSVTQMLYDALRRLRHPKAKRTLWVDQLCINQTDDREKSHQVRLMRTIYKKCTQCLIWLGEIPDDQGFSQPDAEVALGFIDTVASNAWTLHLVPKDPANLLVADSAESVRARKAFKAFIMGGNPWWSRVWTLQEASLPFAAMIFWGPLTLSLQTLENAARTIVQGWHGIVENEAVAAEYLQLVARFLYSANILQDLPSLRNVDYTLSPEVLFTQVTIDLLRFENGLRPLIGARELPHVTPALPSWAIDFASHSSIGPRQTKWWQHSHRYQRWSASGRIRTRIDTSDSKTLSVTGAMVDRIQVVSEVYTVRPEAEVDDQQFRNNIIKSYDLLGDYQNSRGHDLMADYIGGGTLTDAFWRTMLGNLIMAEVPKGVPLNHDRDDFEAYVNKGAHSRLILSLRGHVPNHAFFVTTQGYVGIGPWDTKEQDIVCILGGGRVPFVLREPEVTANRAADKRQKSKYNLVGNAYVHGIMRGEFLNNMENMEVETISLI